MDLASEKLKYRLLSDLTDEDFFKSTRSFSCFNSRIDNYLKSEAYLDHYEFNANTSQVFNENDILIIIF